jgi:YVTN family beta-propeller protein
MNCKSEDLPQCHNNETFGGKVSIVQRITAMPLRIMDIFFAAKFISMKTIQTLFTICVAVILFSSCEETPDAPTSSVPNNLKGVFICNEGAFGQGNGSISFLNSDSGTFSLDLYQAANNLPLGDVVQSIALYDNRAFIAVNNSQKMEVVSLQNFKRLATINGLSSPRYFVGNGNKGFISDWISNKVYVINLNNYQIIDTINAGSGPEEMLIVNNKLFVCNSGGFGDDSTITVVDINSNSVITTITTPINPSSIKLDKDGNIWALCKGSLGSDFTPTPDDAAGALIQINTSNNVIEQQFTFAYNSHPVKMQINKTKDELYFLDGEYGYAGEIKKLSIYTATQSPATIVSSSFYGLGIDPTTNEIYAGRGDFSGRAYVLRFTSNGTLIDSVLAGIAPNGFAFN